MIQIDMVNSQTYRKNNNFLSGSHASTKIYLVFLILDISISYKEREKEHQIQNNNKRNINKHGMKEAPTKRTRTGTIHHVAIVAKGNIDQSTERQQKAC